MGAEEKEGWGTRERGELRKNQYDKYNAVTHSGLGDVTKPREYVNWGLQRLELDTKLVFRGQNKDIPSPFPLPPTNPQYNEN